MGGARERKGRLADVWRKLCAALFLWLLRLRLLLLLLQRLLLSAAHAKSCRCSSNGEDDEQGYEQQRDEPTRHGQIC
jgi:hypothetical protein